MDSKRSRGASPIAVTAALSLAVLLAVTGSYIGTRAQKPVAAAQEEREPSQQQKYVAIEDRDANGIPDWQDELGRTGVATSTATTSGGISDDPVAAMGSRLLSSLFSGFSSLQQLESYTPSQGEELVNTLAANFKAPGVTVLHTKDELALVEASSEERILQYRADMRLAMAHLVDLSAEPEFSLFARFIQTNDPQWLDSLSAAAQKYRIAEQNLLAVNTPIAAADLHLRAVNAVAVYAQTLERLVRFANDPLASMALLRTYNESEREYLLAFDALAKFYVDEVGGN